MRKTLLGLSALLVVSSSFMPGDAEAGRRKRFVCPPCYQTCQPEICQPPKLSGNDFCAQMLMMEYQDSSNNTRYMYSGNLYNCPNYVGTGGLDIGTPLTVPGNCSPYSCYGTRDQICGCSSTKDERIQDPGDTASVSKLSAVVSVLGQPAENGITVNGTYYVSFKAPSSVRTVYAELHDQKGTRKGKDFEVKHGFEISKASAQTQNLTNCDTVKTTSKPHWIKVKYPNDASGVFYDVVTTGP